MSLEDLKQRRQELTGNNDDEQSQDIKLEELKEKRKNRTQLKPPLAYLILFLSSCFLLLLVFIS